MKKIKNTIIRTLEMREARSVLNYCEESVLYLLKSDNYYCIKNG